MDVFGKRDLLYIDMRGDKDVARMYNMEEGPDPRQPKEEAAAASGGDEGGDDAGDDDEWREGRRRDEMDEIQGIEMQKLKW